MSNISLDPPVVCAISFCIPEHPVATPCGHIFDNLALTDWRHRNDSCPVCRCDLRGIVLGTNVALLELIQSWCELQKELTRIVLLNPNFCTSSIPIEDISVDVVNSLSSDTHEVVKSGVWQGKFNLI